MLALFKKEVGLFLYSLIGYLVIGIFLLITSLLLWIFPFEFNILDGGYANLDPLFTLAPWLFLFLIPAVTMRSFSEENKTGTIELVMTKPITDWGIVITKFSSSYFLVFFSLLPTIVYYYSIYKLGNPEGNLDSGGILGSYMGIGMIALCYTSIGLFTSSITNNQIVAFLISICICLIMAYGFDMLGSLSFLSPIETSIRFFGLNYHYDSISRGMLDTRDVIYFLSVTVFFLSLTKYYLAKRRW